LEVYQKAFSTAMKIFHLTRDFTPDEKYALVDQIRDHQEQFAQIWRRHGEKENIRPSFATNSRMLCKKPRWLEFCMACKYLDNNLFKQLDTEYETIIAMLNRMEQQADKFCF